MPDYSSATPYQRELAKALQRAGIEVTLESGTKRFPLLQVARTGQPPDIIHLHWPEHYWISAVRAHPVRGALRFLTEILALKFLGVRFIWTVHNLFSHERRRVRLERVVSSVLARLCDNLIVHCPRARDAVIGAFGLSARRATGRISVIPQGHYIESYQNSVSRENARAILKLNAGETVLLYFGLIRPYKGLMTLITAFRALREPSVKLLIVGKPWTERIRQDVHDWCNQDQRIRAYLEFVRDDDVQVYMNAADAVVLPYKEILTSGTVLLAMSFAKAVIAPRSGCIPEMLDERGAFFYDPDDGTALGGALRKALGANLVEMGRLNQEMARGYDWADIAAATQEVYTRTLPGRRGGVRTSASAVGSSEP